MSKVIFRTLASCRKPLRGPWPVQSCVQTRTYAGVARSQRYAGSSKLAARCSHCARSCSSKRFAATVASPSVSTFTTPIPPVSKVAIDLDNGKHDFSAILLRDLCECPLCVHESSKQRLFSTAEIPTSIRARSTISSTSTPAAIDILWEDDVPGFDQYHKTTLSLDTLREIHKAGTTSGPFQIPPASSVAWDANSEMLPDYRYEQYMNDDKTLYQVISQLHTHGLVFIVDAPISEKSVSSIAERIGPIKDTFYGYTWDVRTVPKAINAAYTSDRLDFHTDLLYFKDPPHIQLLHCMQSSASGGASVFADAFKAAAELYDTNREAFDILATLPVNYHYKHIDSNLYTATKPVFDTRPLRVGRKSYTTVAEFLEAWENKRQHLFQTTGTQLPELNVVDVLDKINWGPPFMAPFSLEQDSMEQAITLRPARDSLNDKVDTWHAAAREFSALLNRPDALHERLMQSGTCVLFNNTRVLHSRRAFSADDAGKPRWLRGTYVDKDPFFSKLRVLRGKFETSSALETS